MNNIYLTKTKNFAFEKYKGDLPFEVDSNLVDNWVSEYNLKSNQTKDFTAELNNQRYRVHLFHSHRGWNAALRLLPSKILSFKELGIDQEELLSICKSTGLVLFCGPTGSGKSTTMNCVIDSLLTSKELGVTITIEDPIEYLHLKDEIFQREVNTDVNSFKDGMIEAVRANPTTIVIGEIRDSATAIEAVRAGLNGHRVFATLHASNVKEAISRLWAFLDDQGDELLVQALQGIVAQHLVNITNSQKYFLCETLKIDNQTKNILYQVLKGSATQDQINHCFNTQERKTIPDKVRELKDTQPALDLSLFNFVKNW